MKFNLRRATLPVSLLIGLSVGCAPAATRGESQKDQSLVTAEDFEKYPNESIESVIQRKVPGVTVTRIDGRLVLQIRGASTLLGEPKPPLYVLNGLMISPGPDGALSGINPHDIQSIRVLKGPEAAIYGIDGANGAIVITTKKAGPQKP
jgi:TonB-dependent SusC/RagA subfamily outer membrane receptor